MLAREKTDRTVSYRIYRVPIFNIVLTVLYRTTVHRTATALILMLHFCCAMLGDSH